MSNRVIITLKADDTKKSHKFIGERFREQILEEYIDDAKTECLKSCAFEEPGEHKIAITLQENLEFLTSMFDGAENITDIKFVNFGTSRVFDMSFMFYKCSSLQSLDLSSFDTIYTFCMDSMFANCESLKSLNLSAFNTENTKSMNDMFDSCLSLESLDLSSFSTTNMKYMKRMFRYCGSLKSLDLASFNTASTEEMDEMFVGCFSLRYVNLSSFDISNIRHMEEMLYYCYNIQTYILNGDFPDEETDYLHFRVKTKYEGIFVVLNQKKRKILSVPKRFKRIKIYF